MKTFMPRFALRKPTRRSYDDALAALAATLEAEGLGILTRIDVAGTANARLGAEFRNHAAIGARHPHLAHLVLTTDHEARAVLPCNVVVYEGEDGNAVVVAVQSQARPAAGGAVEPVAPDVRARLERVLAALD